MTLVTPGSSEATSPTPRKKTFPRKGHTKSRKGCFNCKKRKIKCQETRPSCSNCVRTELECQYPEVTSRWATLPSPTTVAQPQSTPSTFSMEDMKLFHHFIIRAYPHLPVGADAVWKTEIPAFAHQYDFLIHSMLAVAASHLSMNGLGDYTAAALQHRVIAVRLLNESLSSGCATQAEADAKLAACLALTFQSSYMEDGFLEFLTMIRGCMLVTQSHSLDLPTSAFHCFSEENHGRIMQERLRELLPSARIDPTVLDRACESLEAIAPLCSNAKEIEYQRILFNIVQQTYHSPLQAYFAFCQSYNWPSSLQHGEFAAFISPSNQVGQLLLSHFIALQLLQQCTTDFVWSDRDTAPPSGIILAWLKRIDDGLQSEYKQYNIWPMHFGRAYGSLFDKITVGPCTVRCKPPEVVPDLLSGFDMGDIMQLQRLDSEQLLSFPSPP